jgi:hypothetical protein
MAKFYGSNDSHLLKNDLKNFAWSSLLAMLPLVLLLILLKAYNPDLMSPTTFIVLLILVIVVAKFSGPFIRLFKRRSGRYYRGWSGEQDIKRELGNLSDDYVLFSDLHIGQNKGNLDFVVMAPQGVFVLEVKSHGGEIGFNGAALTLNGRSFAGRNFFREVHGQTWALKNYLKDKTSADLYIHSVLVFSNPRARLGFGYHPVNNVQIIQKDLLLGLFLNFPKINYPVARDVIEQALLELV